ncbi:hypothetical protein [Kineococcus sp. SYSU DK005]|uniref:hypothetical protein n=1 Tax=Kineococcus sp. SYSU DK005 TaxID=3383126 RepID=UPI003D7CC361
MDGREVTSNWEALLSERVRTRRTRRGWRQVDVAQRMAEQGFDWTQPVVAAVEAGKRDCNLLELAGLTSVFVHHHDKGGVAGLLDLDDDEEGYAFEGCDPPAATREVTVEMSPGVRVELAVLLSAIRGGDQLAWGLRGGAPRLDWTATEDPMVIKLARALGISTGQVLKTSRRLWGREPQQERDRRLGDVSDVPARTVQARRGHITRAMTVELREELS